MHQSHCPTSVPLQHPVLVLGPVENDNPVTERLKEALDAIEVLQQQVQGLTRRLEDHILDQKKDDFSSNLVFSSIESMKEENDANHRLLEIQISAASKDRTKLRVELEKHTATHIAGARNALQEGHKSYTSVRDKIAALHDRVNSTVNDMNSRTILEAKAFKQEEIHELGGELKKEYGHRVRNALAGLRDVYENQFKADKDEFKEKYDKKLTTLKSLLRKQQSKNIYNSENQHENLRRIEALVSRAEELTDTNSAIHIKISKLCENVGEQKRVKDKQVNYLITRLSFRY